MIVGAAVMCERKATFIQAIFRLDHISQTVLKGMVEHAIDRMKPYPPIGEETNENTSSEMPAHDLDPSEELIRAREMVRHLQEERNRLLGLVGELEAGHSALQSEANTLQAEIAHSEKEKEFGGGERDSKEAAAILARNRTLQVGPRSTADYWKAFSLCLCSFFLNAILSFTKLIYLASYHVTVTLTFCKVHLFLFEIFFYVCFIQIIKL